MFHALLAIRMNQAIYPHFLRFLKNSAENCKIAAVDPTATNNPTSLAFLQGQYQNISMMVNLFERELEQVRETHNLDEQARQATG